MSEHRPFAFGENWSDYAKSVSDVHIEFAILELQRLFACDTFANLSWCDVGSGSGIHAVAAAMLGAKVVALDVDEASCQTTREMVKRFNVGDRVEVRHGSILDDLNGTGRFDVVYSWGVLHHTGAMWSAVEAALDLVSSQTGSRFAVALYRRTHLCGLWQREKRFYTQCSPGVQRLIRRIYTHLYATGLAFSGKSIQQKRENYVRQRGMSLDHDAHDWLGGYPYESCLPVEIKTFVVERGFALSHEILIADEGVKPLGLFGSGCDQFVFQRS